MTTWTPPSDWPARHDSADLVYRVRLRFDEPDSRQEVWQSLADARGTTDGEVLMGGAALTSVGARSVDVTSGGEDALDSLEQAVEEVLQAAADADRARPAVVVEERAVWFEDGDA